jgi:hypothetical protein
MHEWRKGQLGGFFNRLDGGAWVALHLGSGDLIAVQTIN